jgi:hypothetical protein
MLCICTVFMPSTTKPTLYNPRHPERTLLYQTVADHYATWLELASAGQFEGQGERRNPTHSRPHRGGIRAAAHCPGTRAAAVG